MIEWQQQIGKRDAALPAAASNAPTTGAISEAAAKMTNSDCNFDADAPLDTVAAAKLVGLAVATLAKLRCLGGGPAYLKLGRKVVYRRADLADWLGARRVANTTQAAIRLPRRLDDAGPQPPAREINE